MRRFHAAFQDLRCTPRSLSRGRGSAARVHHAAANIEPPVSIAANIDPTRATFFNHSVRTTASRPRARASATEPEPIAAGGARPARHSASKSAIASCSHALTIQDCHTPIRWFVSAVRCLSLLSASSALFRPSWLFPLPGVPPLRSLPYILPAVSHGAGLAGCWLLGALAANAFEKEAYMGTLGDTLSRTWRGGAFSVGVLLLCTQFDYSATLLTQGVDPFEASREGGLPHANNRL